MSEIGLVEFVPSNETPVIFINDPNVRPCWHAPLYDPEFTEDDYDSPFADNDRGN